MQRASQRIILVIAISLLVFGHLLAPNSAILENKFFLILRDIS
ncbi:hypothetical protein Vi05172_g13424 [Venturia inaequalis]|nr:hypothetical protein Vi05172_g13424 [Venturia inaequalis]